MRIAALSDFHIGATEATDSFGHDEGDFLRFLDGLEARCDRIVLLGDIYQTDHGWLPGRRAARRLLQAARERLAALTRRTAEPPYVWVHGNHDAVTAEVLGARTELVLGEDAFRVVFVHGDAFDPVLQAAPRLSETGTWIAGRVRAAGLRRLAEHLEDQDVQIKARRHQTPDGPYVQGAVALLERHQAAAVVMGHTHVPMRRQLPAGLVANTGTCSRGQRMGVWVDTATGELSLIRAS